MTATTDEIFAERRVRAAELALDAARRRVTGAEQEIAALRRQVAELEERELAAAGRAGAEPARLAALLEAEQRLRQVAEQALWAERERAHGLEQELGRRRRRAAGKLAERRLGEAERRVHELEAELELVRRRAAEFEQQVRLAVDAAWRWLGETGERVAAALAELEALRRQPEPRPPRAAPGDELLQGAAPEDELLQVAGPEDELLQRAAPSRSQPVPVEEPVRPERFDAALSRLREQIEADPGRPA